MKCKFCKRELKSKKAIKLGYGPVCAKKHPHANGTLSEDGNTFTIELTEDDYDPLPKNGISFCKMCEMDTATDDHKHCEICQAWKGD